MLNGRKWLLVALVWIRSPVFASDCPDLSEYYPEDDWASVESELEPIFDLCLTNSEYFALIGAAQLNMGELDSALESLERALLLDPANGAALIDFGEALYEDGQLFSAIEVISQVLAREDLPEQLADPLTERRQSWVQLTRQTRWQVDLGAGYDNNLNGAPNSTQIALTLSGEPILLSLNKEYRSASGRFVNAGVAAQHSRLAPELQHTFYAQVRGRFSENKSSDVAQFSGRYSLLSGDRRRSELLSLGLSHLTYAEKALFTGTDVSGLFQLDVRVAGCNPYVNVGVQHQVWHTQRLLDGVEGKVGLGALCRPGTQNSQAVSVEINAINNVGRKSNRLGGDRVGWQALGRWQQTLGPGLVNAQVEVGTLLDDAGYSQLLDNNSRRRVSRGSVLLQYRHPQRILGFDTDVIVSLFHQERESNLELFDTSDTSFELGLSLKF